MADRAATDASPGCDPSVLRDAGAPEALRGVQQPREIRKISTSSESGTPSSQAIPYLMIPSS
jgi:hypothetical protein